MKRIAVFGNRYQGEYLHELQVFFDLLVSDGFEVGIYCDFHDYLIQNTVSFPSGVNSIRLLPKVADCVLSIGGDGTFLRAAQWVGDSGIPILGINTGHLGFLASFYLSEMREIVEALRSDNCLREQRSLLCVSCLEMPEGFTPFALNEVVIQRGDSATMLNVHAEIDGSFLADYLADGVLVSTPTGSTAYNLSIGGPILQPTLSCIAISPIAPHSLTMRPLVVSGESCLKFRTSSRGKKALVSMDGRSFAMECGKGELTITKAPYRITLLRRPEIDFPRILRNKLLWGK